MALKARMATSVLLAVVWSFVLLVPTALAQNYRFNLAENRCDVYIENDGTVRIVYDLTVVADAGSAPLDAFDIGLPNSTYQLSGIVASIDGYPLTDISHSPYVKPGVAVELGSRAIQPGQTGTLHFEATVRNLIYPDTQDAEYASLQFSPTWFDSQFVRGTTRLEVNFHFPLGLTEDEPRYHQTPFTSARFLDDRVVYTWVDERASGSRQYVFGVSFPRQYLAEGVVQRPPVARVNFDSVCESPCFWVGSFFFGWIAITVLSVRGQMRRKMKYMPPGVAVEGTGIKRGLTAVEAAVLLEAPLNRVLTMILFGLVKKGIVVVESEKPLRVRKQDPLPEDERLRFFERRFLKAVGDDGRVQEDELRDMMIHLIGEVNKKLAGFSRKETRAYYKDIAARAWQQVEAADTPEVVVQRWSDGLEWTLLDDKWGDRTRRAFGDRPVVVPTWWHGYRPWVVATGTAPRPAGGGAPVSLPTPRGGGTPVTLPTLPGASFANTVVRGIEGAANTVVSRVESFTGRVTQKTNPPPAPSSSRSGRSGGGGYSCACACACAGCACACAGGGR